MSTKINTKPQNASRPKGLLIPALAFLILMTQIPFIVTLVFSMRSWNLLKPQNGQKFVFFKNFADLMHNQPSIYLALKNTLVLTSVTVILSSLIGLTLAIWLNHKFLGRGLVRTLILTPMLIMPVIAGQIWGRMFFDPGTGLVPWIARTLFHGSFTPMSQFPMGSIITISIWEWTPFAFLILTSGLNSMDQQIVEAAKIDGATRSKLFRYITLPHLTSYLNITWLLGTVLVLPTFGVIYSTTAGGPNYSTTNLSLGVYRELFLKYDVGSASALALADAVLVIIVMTLLVRFLGKILVRNEAMR